MPASSDYSRFSDDGDELQLLVRHDDFVAETRAGGGKQPHDDLEAGRKTMCNKLFPSQTLQAHCRHLRNSTVKVTSVVALAFALSVSYALLQLFLRQRYAYAASGFATPLSPVGQPVERLVSPFGGSDPSLAATQAELDERLLALLAPPSTLNCPWTPVEERKYTSLPAAGPYLFALNLYNNQVVLPTLARTLLSLTNFLGPNNTHISIFENGSTDNTTLILAHFAAALTRFGVPHTILSESRKTDWKHVDRIEQLAVYRNYALRPINDTVVGAEREETMRFKELVFINDVFTCPRDVLELLWQRKEQQADAVCAMDWVPTHSWFGWLGVKSIKFYDNWVARSLNGDLLRSRSDLFAETRDGIAELFDQPGNEVSRDRLRAGLPVPVYSCWNGMLALDASPFQGVKGSAVQLRSAMGIPGECAASESKTIARDFWARGYQRWVMVPSVHVTYDQDVYDSPELVELAHRSTLNSTSLSHLIDWSTVKPPDSVVCYPWLRGWHLELPWFARRFAPF